MNCNLSPPRFWFYRKMNMGGCIYHSWKSTRKNELETGALPVSSSFFRRCRRSSCTELLFPSPVFFRLRKKVSKYQMVRNTMPAINMTLLLSSRHLLSLNNRLSLALPRKASRSSSFREANKAGLHNSLAPIGWASIRRVGSQPRGGFEPELNTYSSGKVAPSHQSGRRLPDHCPLSGERGSAEQSGRCSPDHRPLRRRGSSKQATASQEAFELDSNCSPTPVDLPFLPPSPVFASQILNQQSSFLNQKSSLLALEARYDRCRRTSVTFPWGGVELESNCSRTPVNLPFFGRASFRRASPK
jgi:hypothetical protein